MLKIGLTGGIGSGKSTVSQLFKENGIRVIDCDVISREIFVLYPKSLEEIRNVFGNDFFDEVGNLKRKELGNYVFKENSLKTKLENITLPYIIEEVFKRIAQYKENGEKICVVDAPTLIEVGLHSVMDINILVWVDNVTQFLRVKKRDFISEEQILNRIESQIPLEEKKKYVDFIIDNSKNLECTKEQFLQILNKLNVFKGER